MSHDIPDDLRRELAKYDTPTVCNARELVAPHLRGTGYTTTPMFCANPALPAMVGFAKTVTVKAQLPHGRTLEQNREVLLDYFTYIDAGAKPSVIVIQDLDENRGHGAFWGEVFTNVHKGLGALGTVTNGTVRDLDECAEGFQMLAAGVAPSHGYIHVVEWGTDVAVNGMVVGDGDLVHADKHGAVVIPGDTADQVPAACELMFRREKFLIEASQKPGFGVAEIAAAMKSAAATQ